MTPDTASQHSIAEKLVRERRARLAAERLLDQKSRELFAANERLSMHARALSDTVVEQRQGLAQAQTQAQALQGRNTEIESDLEQTRTVAQLAQRRLWEALETIRDGFAVFDSELRLIIANGAYVSLFQGRCALEAGQNYDRIIDMMAAEGIVDLEGGDRHDWRHEMIARLATNPIPPRVVRLADGRHLRFIDRRGEAGDLVCLTADITETIRRERELEEARARAETASRAKSAFLANMSHELRTPMNGVVGMADLLCETPLNEDQRLYVETIKSSGEALLGIINEVLDYSKAEASRLRLYPEPFDLERCLHEVMLLLQPTAREKGVTLALDYDLFMPTRFIADPGRVRQIVTNLLGNAVKFTNRGSVLARVVGSEVGGGGFDVHLTVEDTGIGIAADHLDHIFGEFNQVEDQSNRKFEGTGLGLAITRQLVRLMGGEIWVESEPGQGSCFGIRLRLEPDEPVVDLAGPPLGPGRVLVVDPAAVSRAILCRQIEAFGLTVTASATAAEAAAIAGGFDVIVADFDLPDADGPALAARLREAGVRAPLILLSVPPVALATDSPVADVLQKPVRRGDLFRSLQALRRAGSAETPAAASGPPEDRAGRRMRVLAAEDNRTNQLVFSKMVKDFDIDLVFAANGQEALELFRELRPDIIFMDISMPVLDGRDATRAIRAAEAAAGLGGHVPIVAMTAHAMDGDRDGILAAGLDDYLTKPLRKADIAAQLAAYRPDSARPLAPAPG